MKRLAALPLLLVILSGCSQPDMPHEEPPEPEPQATAEAESTPECLQVSDGAIHGIQWGLDDKQTGYTATRAAAIKNPSSDKSWFVAAEFNGPGVPNSIGVWTTLTDPTTAPDTIAYSSVDAMAKEFSSYMQPVNYSSALAGVDEVKACLTD